ncbi:SGNH/GDSL hydrolase family protein [Mycolicibacterium sp. 120266]|uniref:SGNH/GDSL hydrolase family protein n=1 Tax=Mycolicibacterium sp. 120266 TaxID=3090601 RepID=UPI00299ED6DE|nr:SGNH/GDSL hydrolase family protein [Mycolicibacterium sp. 120266]MDX1875205.1 SGNH/GDSL hydrolase family protein [Mycolicibacterium sp. 120266]
MRRLALRALAIGAAGSLALAGLPPAAAVPEAPVITSAVFFGDSLTDAGTYGFRFTTNPGRTWAQHVADTLGQPDTPNEHVDSYDEVYQGRPGRPGPGGLNYAEGGARAELPYSVVSKNPQGTPISADVQVQRYLAQHARFRPDELVTLWIGTNDVALNFDPRFGKSLADDLRADRAPSPQAMDAERARVRQAAAAEARTASTVLRHGAQHLVVFTLFDLGVLPWFETTAARNYVNDLTAAYNGALLDQLPKDPRLQIFDTGAFVTDLLTDPARYGFTHGANEDACAQPGQDYCDADTLKEPDADHTYVFAAAEHFTTHAHELLAEQVQQQVGVRPKP